MIKEYKELIEMLMSEEHKDIIKIIDRVADGYSAIRSEKWTLFTKNDNENKVMPMFVSHTDTVSKKKPSNFKYKDGVLSDAKGVLGADDRAGCYGLFLMMQNKTDGYFLFTDEEECGGIGAGEFSKSEAFVSIMDNISALIELDRRGANDVATYGYDNDDLIWLFTGRGYKEAYGSYTDVVTLSGRSDIACINLSIGYYNEHSKDEYLVIDEMMNTINILLKDMPEELYLNRFDADAYDSKFRWYGHESDALDNALLCDFCQEHKLLYETQYGFVCEDCYDYVLD